MIKWFAMMKAASDGLMLDDSNGTRDHHDLWYSNDSLVARRSSRFRIPDGAKLDAGGTSPAWHLAATMSGTLMLGLLAGLLVFLAGAFCWRRGWLGGGDVKLLAATAVLVSPSLVVNLLLDVALAGGARAMIYLAMARLVAPPYTTSRPSGMLRRIRRAELYRIYRRGPLPYASAIAAGTLFVLFKG